VLLVFSDPKCGPCNALAPRLEESYRRSGDVEVILVSRGDRVENREKVEEYGLTFPVVLQRQWEVSRLYAMFATPIAYLIDELAAQGQLPPVETGSPFLDADELAAWLHVGFTSASHSADGWNQR